MNAKFWCSDPAAAAAICREKCPEDAARSISIADDVCRNIFVFRDHWEMERTNVPVQFGPKESDIVWETIPAGDPEWLYAMNRHTSFVNLGKAWRYTGDERYAEKFARLIDDWIARVPLTEKSRSDTWRSLESGLRCEYWLRALRLFEGSGVLTEERMERIEQSLRVHAEYLVEASNVFHRLSNWGVLQDHGLFLLGLYFENEEWCRLAAERIDKNLHISVFRDGSQWEQSPMYHCEVLHCAMDTVLVARQNGYELPQRLVENVYKMCLALEAWVKPDGRLIPQSDSDDTDARDVLATGALVFGDARLRTAAGDELFEENWWDFGPEAEKAYASLPRSEGGMKSAYLADSGNVVLRGENGAWAHMHCGCMGSGHGHADLLHLDAGVGGEDVLIDVGRYTYVDTPLRHALKEPAAHNTTRVDGEDFGVCRDSWGYDRMPIPLKGENVFTEKADYASGMHLGYLDRGVVTGRKLVFLKEQGVLVIFDQFFGKGAHSLEQNFHLGEGRAELDGQTLRWTGERNAAQLLCLGEGLELSMSRQPYSRDYNELKEGDVLTVRRTSEDFGWFVTVLSMDAGEAREVSAELLPVSTLNWGNRLQDGEAQAVRVVKDGRETVVLVGHAEAPGAIGMLTAGGYASYGKALVFGAEDPEGTCLVW